jgi:uncharacterized surface protein with fasciclin (FAS1) repeats
MKLPFSKWKKTGSLVLVSLFFSLALTNCVDQKLPDNYYSFKGELVTDFLNNRSATYSEFIDVLKRAGIYELLSTYGEFTCFAPTNAAMNDYLTKKGFASVADLSKEECDTIAYTHLMKGAFFTTDLTEGVLPAVNMLDRNLTITFASDSVNHLPIYLINKNAEIIARDDSVQNGVVHTMNKVISSSNNMLPDLMQKDTTIRLFCEAMIKTHMADSMFRFIDPTYTIDKNLVTKGVAYHTGYEDEVGYFPAKRYFKFTAFVEKDEVYRNNGIHNINELADYAKRVYDEVYPEDAGKYDTAWTDRRNPLNRFVAYHLLDRLGNYNELTVSGDVKNQMQVSGTMDATDIYETMCPSTVIQCSSPAEGLFLNRKGVGTTATIAGVKVLPPSSSNNQDQSAVNGVYHYINNILTYNKTTKEIVFNTRFRFDATTLSADFMTSGARGRPGTASCTAFKKGFVKDWKFTDETFVSCRNRHVGFDCYQGDEIVLLGKYDFTFKLPPVPEGTYEVRLGYCALASRGIIQIYFDNKPCGIPLDLRVGATNPEIGWVSDVADDPEYNNNIDKAMRNRGYMKAPDSMCKNWYGNVTVFRTESGVFRRIMTTTYLDRNPHYLRMKQVLDNSKAEFAFDYIEICPKSVYNSPEGEDKH